ncbi:MAG TPA: sensor histidine kinase [Streptosporangiaceae bacterium]|nr:sensor histidine kinase [Streptosporangiaceae bacterium]
MSPGTDSVPGPPADEPQPTPEPRWPPPFTVTILPYMMLFFCVFLTLIFQQATPVTMAINVGLSALAGAWIVAWHNRPRMTLVFMTGLILIMMVLVFRASWYGFFTLTAYFYSIKLLPWPSRLIGVGFVGFMAAVSQSYYLVKTDSTGALVFLVVVLVNVGGSCLFTYYNWNSTVQAERRQQAVDELSEANRKLEAALAENAGLHAQLLTQAREAGVLDERHRIAREIHDTLAQGLTGIITQLQAAEQADQDPAAWRKHVQAATGLARESLTETRRSVHALRPESLESAGLSDALAAVSERWSSLHQIPVQVTTTGIEVPLAQQAEFVLLRTAQEALANVAKHARARRVGLTLSYLPGEIALDVRDDGRGFDPAAVPDGGFGLVAMRQRVQDQSGALLIESEPGGGTAVSARLPVGPVPATTAPAEVPA